jgi:transposase-like protein
MIRDLVKELRIFERDKVPEDVKILGIAIYFQTSSFRRTAKILSELHKVSYNAVRRWIKKIEERLPIATERKGT